MKGEQPGVMLYFELRPTLEFLDSAQLGRLFLAILDYGERGIEPEFEDTASAIVWSLLRRRLDLDRERYEERCRQQQSRASKRWHGKGEQPEDTEAGPGTDEDAGCAAACPGIAEDAGDANTNSNSNSNNNSKSNSNSNSNSKSKSKSSGRAGLGAVPGPRYGPHGLKEDLAAVLKRVSTVQNSVENVQNSSSSGFDKEEYVARLMKERGYD